MALVTFKAASVNANAFRIYDVRVNSFLSLFSVLTCESFSRGKGSQFRVLSSPFVCRAIFRVNILCDRFISTKERERESHVYYTVVKFAGRILWESISELVCRSNGIAINKFGRLMRTRLRNKSLDTHRRHERVRVRTRVYARPKLNK